MSNYTKAQLATRILRDAGLLGADETASAADLSWAQETITSTFQALQRKGINIWDSSEDNIPEEYLVVLSQRIVLDVGPAFGLLSVADAAAAKRALEADLRTMSAQPATGAILETEYM